jgi:hypothetical protein
MAVEFGDLHAQSSEVLLILLVIQHQEEECSCFAGLLAAALWSIECLRLDLIPTVNLSSSCANPIHAQLLYMLEQCN